MSHWGSRKLARKNGEFNQVLSGKGDFSLDEGKKSAGSVTEGCVVSYSLCDFIFYLRCRAETIIPVLTLSLNLS